MSHKLESDATLLPRGDANRYHLKIGPGYNLRNILKSQNSSTTKFLKVEIFFCILVKLLVSVLVVTCSGLLQCSCLPLSHLLALPKTYSSQN
ncbi:hypothetical protein C2G38_2246933 [Gigaspora rosea]|uniref:Uncharacterized protein n=1 Tax=Gigaspora rosea TaxID=44941 RepID=A0A397V2F1_9GLOM|nr:hypothetical protein C2G38_2246933 [Gigaspora rosea]